MSKFAGSLKNRRYISRFLIVGVIAFLFNYTILTALYDLAHFSKIASEAISMLFSVHMTFVLHDYWTYNQSTSTTKHYTWSFKRRYFSYLASNTFSAICTIVLFGIFSLILPNLLALGLSASLSLIWNFFMNLILVWRQPAGAATEE